MPQARPAAAVEWGTQQGQTKQAEKTHGEAETEDKSAMGVADLLMHRPEWLSMPS